MSRPECFSPFQTGLNCEEKCCQKEKVKMLFLVSSLKNESGLYSWKIWTNDVLPEKTG